MGEKGGLTDLIITWKTEQKIDNLITLEFSCCHFLSSTREKEGMYEAKKGGEKQEVKASPALHWKILSFSSNIQHLCLSAFVVVSKLG